MAQPRCACGQPKSYRTAQCWTCYNAGRRGPSYQCLGCGAAFWRFHSPTKRDARRYCSRACFFAMKKTRAAENQRVIQARKQSESVESEIHRALRQEAQRTLLALRLCAECGGPLSRLSPGGRFCRRCVAYRIATATSRGRRASREVGPEHLCPNCGQTFRGHVQDVYCSLHCAKQYKARHDRCGDTYPTLSHMPLDERNQIAELIALTRAAYRKIDQVRKSGISEIESEVSR